MGCSQPSCVLMRRHNVLLSAAAGVRGDYMSIFHGQSIRSSLHIVHYRSKLMQPILPKVLFARSISVR